MLARKAVTLIELLISVALLSLLLYTSFLAYRMQLRIFEPKKAKTSLDWLNYKRLKESIESMRYYVVYPQQEEDFILNKVVKTSFYFQGTPTSFSFITNNAIVNPNHDSLVKIECKDKKLLYTEEPLFKKMDFLNPNFTELAKQLTLATDIDCSFNYK
ncbi:MAG: prepilin-type N-terminal cleavage/methylation domain-containing protein, partial [Epsilonproteobacteria bacterium]|nr:prepilin-type N-terminal cleavage/methylation domain-containing protein [Campylobacterota bacterium]